MTKEQDKREKQPNHEHGEHRKRVKKEFLDHGMEHFPDHKILEMVLYYVIPREDTNPIAHRLINRFGSISGVFNAPYDLLMETRGVGPAAAAYIKMITAVNSRYMIDAYSTHDVITTYAEAMEYMRYRFLSDSTECVLLACLGKNGKVLYCDRIAKGTLEKVDIIPSDVIKACLRADAVRAILAHNHPVGFCNPSRKDLETTFMLHKELNHIGVELFDHIIVASDGVYSMKDNGMFPMVKEGMWID